MTDDNPNFPDIESMDSGDVPEPGPNEPELLESELPGPDNVREAGEEAAAREYDRARDEKRDHERGVGHVAAEVVAKGVGIAVELGSILGGQGGEIVRAERELAEDETEDLLNGDDEG